MHHRTTYMQRNFQQNRAIVDQSKPCTQSYLQNNRKLQICNLQFEFRNQTSFRLASS